MVVIRRGMETSRLRRENQALRRRETAPADMLGDSAPFRTLLVQSRQGHALERAGAAVGPRRIGQGTGRALYPRQFQPLGRPFRQRRLRDDRRRTDGRGAVRHGKCRDRRDAGPAGRGRWRGDLFRRGRRSAAGHAIQDPARAGRPDLPARGRQRQDQGRSAGDLLDQPRSGGRDRRGRFRRELYHRLNVVPVAVPSLESGARTSRRWPRISSRCSTAPKACRSGA